MAEGGPDARKLNNASGAAGKGNEGRGAASKQSEGIGLSFFKKNCSFLAGCLPEIVERILVAHGLDIES